jgi:SAM-dependent methyltransferase
MHKTAMLHGRLFFESYVTAPASIVDIGAQDVNGSLRSVAPEGCTYTGVDFVTGRGVDVVISDAYSLPFEDETFDVAVTSSCFEHSEFFWLTFLEVLRVLKPHGLLYLNVPSNGPFHRYPVDCWRFYPDSGVALQNWARRGGIDAALLESFIGPQNTGAWNDFIGVFVRSAGEAARYPRRIIETYPSFTNGLIGGRDGFINEHFWPEDQRKLPRRIERKLGRLAGREPE